MNRTLWLKTWFLFGIIFTSSIIPIYGQQEYTYTITWEPGELTRWGGHLWTIRTREFSGRLVDESSIDVLVTWQYVDGARAYLELRMRYICYLATIFLLKKTVPETIRCSVIGELRNGETFYVHSPIITTFPRRP
jgi:hypothetical protein